MLRPIAGDDVDELPSALARLRLAGPAPVRAIEAVDVEVSPLGWADMTGEMEGGR
jgi:hypothetical protein